MRIANKETLYETRGRRIVEPLSYAVVELLLCQLGILSSKLRFLELDSVVTHLQRQPQTADAGFRRLIDGCERVIYL